VILFFIFYFLFFIFYFLAHKEKKREEKKRKEKKRKETQHNTTQIANPETVIFFLFPTIIMDVLRQVAGKNSAIRAVVHDDVTSYIVQDYAYKVSTDLLPIRARGLFEKQGRIVARGYDKFFNVGEVPGTQWTSLAQHTQGPYFATLKHNGCIIFVSYDDDDALSVRVSSKNSLTSAHAARGRQWVNAHLAKSGAAMGELANALKIRNATAVFEMCDDEFEEHVLPYKGDKAGLYMHGLVKNDVMFESYHVREVQEFAILFGFHVTPYAMYASLLEVKLACESYCGPPIEGWVIRAGNTYFKYKCDEPYLMWRQWREITKKFLIFGITHNVSATYAESVKYCSWVRRSIIKDPHLFSQYLNNKGILATRERYYRETESGILQPLMAERRLLIVPVGAPAVGKSTVGRVLSDLLRGHIVENDCLPAVKGVHNNNLFENTVAQTLMHNRVVIADRNNHLAGQRKKLVGTCDRLFPNLQIWFISWDIPDNRDKHNLLLYCNTLCDRIIQRSRNHPTLTPQVRDYRTIVHRFMHQRSPTTGDRAMESGAVDAFRANVRLADDATDTILEISRQLPLFLWTAEFAILRAQEHQYDLIPRSQKQRNAVVHLVVAPEQISDIIAMVPRAFSRAAKDYHITLYYGSDDTDLCRRWTDVQCRDWAIDVQSVCFDDTIMAVIVAPVLPFAVPCCNTLSHITIAMRPGVSPVMSNAMLLGKHNTIALPGKVIFAHGPHISYP
jgi:RNA ligase/tRNA ligase kinase domain/Fungal tRNA ligase phosphodiesterase domain